MKSIKLPYFQLILLPLLLSYTTSSPSSPPSPSNIFTTNPPSTPSYSSSSSSKLDPKQLVSPISSKSVKLRIARYDHKDGIAAAVAPPPDRSTDSCKCKCKCTCDDESTSASSPKNKDEIDDRKHGPSKVVLGAAIGLSCLIFLIVFLVFLSKWFG